MMISNDDANHHQYLSIYIYLFFFNMSLIMFVYIEARRINVNIVFCLKRERVESVRSDKTSANKTKQKRNAL